MRVAIGAVQHESNSFSPIPTPLAAFHPGMPDLLEGDLLLQHSRGTKTALGGFLDVAAERGWSVVGTIGALAMPSGTVPAVVYDELKHRLFERIRAAAPLDGVLLYLHGAMCSETAPDAETDLCREVRSVIGPSTPLVLELDLHGNITAGLCDVVDAIFAFETNPHVDIYERGVEAARCLARILDGDLPRPRTYISKPPMLPPTINMRTSEEPMRTLLDRALRWEAEPCVINASVLPGFP